MAEIPLVIVNVMRGGPSTGLPTKFEQADLFQAMYGTSGDSPKAIIAPTDAEDTFVCGNIAFQIAEKYQMPVFVLTDQFLSARMESTDPFNLDQFEVSQRLKPEDNDENFLRYKLTENGVSPMPSVGQKGVIYQTSGLEHYENGRPTSDLDWHQKMSDKRQLKLDNIAKEYDFVRFSDNKKAKTGVIAWGSSKGAVKEAVQLLEKEGIDISFIIPQLIYPLPEHVIQPMIDKFDKIIVVELSHSGQFFKYLKSELHLPRDTYSYCRVGGKPFNVSEIYDMLKKQYV
jgi:2-oxoglutarate ferredoxin oxidoreductase subunit alpha